MFCNSCKSARPENEAPCPNCGAPSSLLEQFEDEEQGMMEPVATTNDAPDPAINQPMSMQLVPVPQQQQLAFPTEQLPFPVQQPATVYIPATYTKPRPIIARSRIINGILSIIVMSLLLCGGSVYYANATGKIAGIERLLGIIPPSNVQVANNGQIADPPDKVDWGPARNIIPAAATTLHVDPNSFAPRERDTIFQVGVPFYVTFNVTAMKAGSVVVIWSMNGHFYQRSVEPINPKLHPSANVDLQMTYFVAAEGTVEIDWMDAGRTSQLAQRLYFAVR
ncbi:MAG: hypothetical protein JO031_07705 [Ktedonobacteraceae bacterium]|nr:hypothetical protein [Ktedonobacteraceae bacterium]